MAGEAPAVDWEFWEALILERGVVIDRPRASCHPRYPDMVYTLDYGYIPDTKGGDDAEVDVFVGAATTGLSAALITRHALKDDTGIKLLWNLNPEEIAMAQRFLETGAMSAALVYRNRKPS